MIPDKNSVLTLCFSRKDIVSSFDMAEDLMGPRDMDSPGIDMSDEKWQAFVAYVEMIEGRNRDHFHVFMTVWKWFDQRVIGLCCDFVVANLGLWMLVLFSR